MSNTTNTSFSVTYNTIQRIWKFTFATSPDPLNKWVNNDGFSLELIQDGNNKFILITDETTNDTQAFTVDYTLCSSPSGPVAGNPFTWMNNVAALFG